MVIAGSLIALSLGYKVFLDATKEKGSTRSFGRILGTLVIIIALCGTVCGILYKVCSYSGKADCKLMSKCAHVGSMMSSICPMGKKGW
ncbi:MAG: hypothetical protein A3C47_02750 [Omnitrophica bacterium RIFCSPHIGHO2_02_FULL_51_18]|nr:MAG: hypothetical protein A3C47_02750 [Omnitrophica bacterium RIFCSPHIGHO2_02_FULL_51_18]